MALSRLISASITKKGTLEVADTSRTKLTLLDQVTPSHKVKKKIIVSASTLYAGKGDLLSLFLNITAILLDPIPGNT